MALFKIEKGLAADLSKNRPKVHDGWCYFTTDDGKFYIDIANDENAVLTNYPGGAGNRIPLNAFYADRVNFVPQIGAGHDKTTGELHLQIITGKKYDTTTNTVVDNTSGYLKLPAASKGKEGILSLDTQFIGGTKVLTDSPVFADGVKLAAKNTLTSADFTLDKVSTCTYVMSLAKQTNVNTGNLFLYSSGNNNLYHNSSDNKILTQKNVNDTIIPWGGNTTDGISAIVMAASYLHSANRIQFAKPAGIVVEYSRDNGATWTDYALTNEQKIALVSGIGLGSSILTIGKHTSGVTVNDKMRITLKSTAMGCYTKAKKLLLNVSTQGASSSKVLVEHSKIGSDTTYVALGTYNIGGWSGWNAVPLDIRWGGSSTQTSQSANVRLTFSIGGLSTNTSYTNALALLDIMLLGETYWSFPSDMAKTGHLYSWDTAKNATFPAGIKATTTLQVSGASTLSAVTASALTVNGDVSAQNIVSAKTNTYTLGTSTNKWKAVYATSFIGNGASLTNLTAANLTGVIADTNLKEIFTANKTYGSTSGQQPSFDETFLVPYINVDKYGRVTGGNTASVSLPKYDIVTDSKAGLMSSDMLATLNKINVNAEVNQNAFSQLKVGNSTYDAPGKTSTATFAGKNLTATLDTTNGKVTYELTAGGIQAAIGGIAATEEYVSDSIAALVGSAPSTLDTLGKLAEALRTNPDVVTVLEEAIATKVSKAGDTMTNKLTISAGGLAVTGTSTFANKVTLSQQLEVTGATTLSSVSMSGDLTTSGNITPTTTSLNLGSSTKPWANIYGTNFSGNAATATNANNGIFYVEGNTTGTEGTWTGTNINIPSLYKGLTIAYKIGIKGISTTEKKTTLSLTTAAGTSGNIAVYRNNSQITTHLGVGTVVLLTYDGSVWRWADYDSNDGKVRQYNTATSSTTEYPLLFRYNTTAVSSYESTYTRFSSAITATAAGTLKAVAIDAGNITASNSLKVTSETDVTVGTAASGAVQITGGATIAKHLQAAGKIYIPSTGGKWVSGMDKTKASIAITTVQSESSYHPYLYIETFGNHVFNLGGLKNTVGFHGYYKGRTENSYDWRTYWDVDTGKLTHNKDFEVSASTASTSKTTGAVIVAGGMGVGGSIYANAVDITTTLVAAGATTLKSSLSVSGITTLDDTLSVAGTATMCQINPKTDSSYSLGTSTVRWTNGYFDAIYTPSIKENLRITGSSADVPLTIRPASSYTSTYLKFEKGDGTRLGSYGFSAADTPVIYMNSTSYTGNSKLIHEKNQASLTINVNNTLASENNTYTYKPLRNSSTDDISFTIDSSALFYTKTFDGTVTITEPFKWSTVISGNSLPTGSYIIQVEINDGGATNGISHWSERYTGFMTWYASTTNSRDYDEIVLHKAGHASNAHNIYLRTQRQSRSDFSSNPENSVLLLQMSCDIAAPIVYTITARKLL